MQTSGKVADNPDIPVLSWNPVDGLETMAQDTIRFSRGFCQCQPQLWFDSLGLHWMSLLHAIEAEVKFVGLTTELGRSSDCERLTAIEVDGEVAFIGLSDESLKVLAGAVGGESSPVGQSVVAEYLFRRLLSTLMDSWKGDPELRLSFVSSEASVGKSIVGSVRLEVSISGAPVVIWFGLGTKAVGRFDGMWRDKLLKDFQSQEDYSGPLEESAVSIELTELAIPPAMLIDYMRSGAVIDLEIPVSKTVLLKINRQPWVEGDLCQFEDKFAVRVTNLSPAPREFPEHTTRVSVEIARNTLDEAGIIEHAQKDVLLLTDTEVSAQACLVISGENVANALVGQIGNNFALRILPK